MTGDDPLELYNKFKSPSSKYRAKPFWSLNGKLEKEELIRQINLMKKMGMGGYFMHSRTGLVTEYLSDEWFKLMNDCTDAGNSLDMESWLYDEDRWPSGTAGGMVTMNPKNRVKMLYMDRVPVSEFSWSDNIIAAYATDIEGVVINHYTRIYADTKLATVIGATILKVTIEEHDGASFFNGYTDCDRMNSDTTKDFIESTYEKYKDTMGNRFGKEVPGVFSDEPNRGSIMSSFSCRFKDPTWCIPWTYTFFDDFKDAYGYDLLDRLPEVYFKYKGSLISEVSWHYVEICMQLFIKHHAQPIRKWCNDNNLLYTGHILHEDCLVAQVTMSGSMLRYYEHMDCPGVDTLGSGHNLFWVVKQLSSAARQTGKKWLLSELYGVSGWDFNFEGFKNIGDWQALLGINLRCPHLSWYTMKGEAKRDCPGSILHQSTYCDDYNYIEDYYARLAVVMTEGSPVCDTLVIYPIESVNAMVHHGWVNGLGSDVPEIIDLETKYTQTFKFLMGAHIDFDYGDEEMIGRLYSIEKDSTGRAVLRIGHATYRQILVSGLVTIRTSTLNILREFIAAGGKVVFAGEVPQYVNALPCNDAVKISASSICVPFDRDAVVDALCKDASKFSNRILPVEITLEDGTDAKDIFVQARYDSHSGAHYMMLLNSNWTADYSNVTVKINFPGFIQEWDAISGEKFAVPSIGRTFVVDFPHGTSKLYVMTKSDEKIASRTVISDVAVFTASNVSAVSFDELNVAVLNQAALKVNEEDWLPFEDIIQLDQKIRTRFGFEMRGGEMIQPWFAIKHNFDFSNKADIELKYEFVMDYAPTSSIELVIENADDYVVLLNGKPVDTSSNNGYWVDPCFKRYSLNMTNLVLGKNSIVMKSALRLNLDIEAIYLLGDFGVTLLSAPDAGPSGKISALTSRTPVSLGNLWDQGLAFYTGRMDYLVEFDKVPTLTSNERVFLRTEKPAAALLKVLGCTSSNGVIAWAPYEVDVTDALVIAPDGKAHLNIQLVPTRYNTFGHVPYKFAPSGLITAPQLIIRK